LPEVTVSHPALQDALIAEAARRGVRVFRPARTLLVQAITPEVEITSGDESVSIRPRLIVGADGRASTVRKWMGAKLVRDPRHHWLGGALFDRVDLAEGATHGANFTGGRTFIFPRGDGVARAYLVASDEIAARVQGSERAQRFIERCASVMPLGSFGSARSSGPVAFLPNNDVWSTVLARGPFVLIGDAAGANDPSLGQGLSLVFRDVRELHDLLGERKTWASALAEFEKRRRVYFEVLRVHAKWTAELTVDSGIEADMKREKVEQARELDPTAGGFAMIFSRGPDDLKTDESSRAYFFGEDLV
jgi:menaquinone-9 beta-reductase